MTSGSKFNLNEATRYTLCHQRRCRPKYDIVVTGYDAGAGQKNAVRKKLFSGSITQDPYQFGYKAVELAFQNLHG